MEQNKNVIEFENKAEKIEMQRNPILLDTILLKA